MSAADRFALMPDAELAAACLHAHRKLLEVGDRRLVDATWFACCETDRRELWFAARVQALAERKGRG